MGKKLRDVRIPAFATTSCCFGGPNLEWLFVTTASLGAGKEEGLSSPTLEGFSW